MKQNIQLTSKINKIRDIQLFTRNFIKENNIQNIKMFTDETDIVQRQFSVQSINKWKDFRERKSKVIQEFVKVKRYHMWIR